MFEPQPFHYEVYCNRTHQFHSFESYCGADVFIEENYEYLNSNDNSHLAGYMGSTP